MYVHIRMLSVLSPIVLTLQLLLLRSTSLANNTTRGYECVSVSMGKLQVPDISRSHPSLPSREGFETCFLRKYHNRNDNSNFNYTTYYVQRRIVADAASESENSHIHIQERRCKLVCMNDILMSMKHGYGSNEWGLEKSFGVSGKLYPMNCAA